MYINALFSPVSSTLFSEIRYVVGRIGASGVGGAGDGFSCANRSYPQLLLNCMKYNSVANMSSASSENFTINEIEGDLFSAPSNSSLAHCVGADMAMGAGIAVKFRQTYGQIDKLLAQNVGSGGVAILQDKNRFIYYLVTKQYSYEKPTYNSLRSSLTSMKEHMVKNDVKNLAIPRIGCGIDGLEWDKVKSELTTVFEKVPITITVYNFVPK